MLSLTPTRVLLVAASLGAISAGLLARPARAPQPDGTLWAGRSSGSYEADLAGAAAATLRGAVDVGTPRGPQLPGSFVITLGAHGNDGALVFRRHHAARLEPGTYPIGEEPAGGGLTALVVTGSPTRPRGAFWGQHGTLTITHTSRDRIAGRFDLRARGFLAADLAREDREVTARGSFTASLPAELAGLE